MILTYLSIFILVIVIIRTVVELVQIIIYGTVPKKQVLTKAFQRLEGRKRSSYNLATKEKSVKGLVSKYIQTILACIVSFMVAYFLFRRFLPSILIAVLCLFYSNLKSY